MIQVTRPTVLLAGLAAVATARVCQNLTIPITISAQNTKFTLQAPANDIEVTNFFLNLAQPGANFTQTVLNTNDSVATITGNYSIGATYCEPDSGPGSALQILTHGIAFDRSYWDFGFASYNYSYANAALARNYSVFFYDRLGLGASTRGDPVNEIQTNLELAALAAVTSKLRGNQVAGVPAYPKLVHVGHSYGSVLSYALVQANPDLSNGLVLTGFGQAQGSYSSFFTFGGNYVVARNASASLAAYPAGYMASGDRTGVQTNFFGPDNFDPAVLQAAYVSNQPVTVGELMTIGGGAVGNNTFAGPVLVITGERDIPFCGGNCNTSTPPIPDQSKQYFTNATTFDAIVVPKAGHSLNLEYTAATTYTSIHDFLDQNL
ncbi:Alpha/beta hydrolase family-domain-containing protein [Annulohypoxylon truncatum]|uniref:Alpha/beta hydrolase family-domain-containing protein n=1 Tax=Annulohypoxylon truncatum TaxID=327061 RepID=UPI002008021E|nr:Alpha/beta hydrolase family-domain-containing protein [Annulohypoxylon truncatum]KAI1210997.1 Alpha/beta hydrolase family-domain-containing protein [Annulohypoxylon truncatum]